MRSPNLPDKNQFEPSYVLKTLRDCIGSPDRNNFSFLLSFHRFLINEFLHLGFCKKHMLNESGCVFWGEKGLSRLTAGSVWYIDCVS